VSFDPSAFLSLVSRNVSAAQSSQGELLQLLMQQRAQEQREQQEQIRFGDQLLGLIAQEGGDVKKAAGLIPPNVLPPGRVEAFGELAKIQKQRKRREQAERQIGPTAATLAGAQEEQRQAGSPESQRQAVTTQAQAISSLFGLAGEDPQARQDIATQLSGALARENLALRQGAQQQRIERRQVISDATRERLIEDLSGLIALSPESPVVLQRVMGMVQEQFPEASDVVGRAVMSRAALKSEIGIGASRPERIISMLPRADRTQARRDLLSQSLSPTQTVRQPTPISEDRALQLIEQDDRTIAALDIGHGILRIIQQDPAAVGFGARIRRAIQSAGEVARGVDDVLFPGAFNTFQDIALSRLEAMTQAQRDDPEVQRLNSMLLNPNAAEVDYGMLMLAFFEEQALTGGRRFSITAVNKILDRLAGGATRPPSITARVLETSMRRMEREVRRSRKRLHAVSPDLYERMEPTLDSIPSTFIRQPDYIMDPQRGLVPFQEEPGG